MSILSGETEWRREVLLCCRVIEGILRRTPHNARALTGFSTSYRVA
jgi:hypothetical protein